MVLAPALPHYLDDSTLLLFDNGNTRRAGDPSAHSRGQVWKLDEDAMTATLVFNVDLGNYSPELGAAERMPNGNYVFDSGSQGRGPVRPVDRGAPRRHQDLRPGGGRS